MVVLEAIGRFFAAIFKGIWIGISSVFKGIAWFFVTTVRLLIEYFIVYIPVVVMAGFAIFWIFNPEGPSGGAYTTFNLLDSWGYDWNLTNLAVTWLEETPEDLLILINGIIRIAAVILAAIFEFFFVYLIFGVIGTLISALIYFIINILIFFVLPAGAVVYSCIIFKNADSYNRWFHALCTILTLVCSVICYIFAFSAL